jgi:hypothetical protein
MKRRALAVTLASIAIGACSLLRPLDDYDREPPFGDGGGPQPDAPNDGALPDGQTRTPTVIAQGLTEVGDLVIEGDRIYFAVQDAVVRCPSNGCVAQPEGFAMRQRAARSLVSDGTTIYWVNDLGFDPDAGPDGGYTGAFESCPVAGCGGAPTPYALGLNMPSSTVVPTILQQIGFISLGNGNILRVRWGFAGSTMVFASGQTDPQSLVYTSDSVYWVNRAGSGEVQTAHMALLDGGVPEAPRTLAREDQPSTLATDGKVLVWGARTAIRKCALPDCPNVETLAPDQTPRTVRVDATHAYWTNTDGRVMRCELAGCNQKPTVLATGQADPWGLVLDANYVYWSTRGDGRIQRLAK